LDTVVISLGVEGIVCEEQEGRVNVYNALLLHSARVQGHTATVLTPQGPENSRTSSRTPVFAHIPDVAFPLPSSRLKKFGEKGQRSKKGKKELGVELP
jgi:hypothetical protein